MHAFQGNTTDWRKNILFLVKKCLFLQWCTLESCACQNLFKKKHFVCFSESLSVCSPWKSIFLTIFINNASKTIQFYSHPVCLYSRFRDLGVEHSDLLGSLISWVRCQNNQNWIRRKKNSLEQLCGVLFASFSPRLVSISSKDFLCEVKFPFLAPSTWLINFTFSFHGPFAMFKQHGRWIGVFCVSSIRNSIHLVSYESAKN